jgi:hypothetical protein
MVWYMTLTYINNLFIALQSTIVYYISSKLPSDRLNNHSRLRDLRTFLYDVADL